MPVASPQYDGCVGQEKQLRSRLPIPLCQSSTPEDACDRLQAEQYQCREPLAELLDTAYLANPVHRSGSDDVVVYSKATTGSVRPMSNKISGEEERIGTWKDTEYF